MTTKKPMEPEVTKRLLNVLELDKQAKIACQKLEEARKEYYKFLEEN